MKIINPSVTIIIGLESESIKALASMFCNEQAAQKKGEMLKKRRKAAGKTQKEMAEILGLKQSTYSNYENDIRTPDDETWQKIADALDISTDRLMPKKGEYEE